MVAGSNVSLTYRLQNSGNVRLTLHSRAVVVDGVGALHCGNMTGSGNMTGLANSTLDVDAYVYCRCADIVVVEL